MQTIYFDRNVFADICELRNGLRVSDVEKVKRAIESNLITIPASVTLIEETIRVLQESEEKYNQQIETVLNLVDKRKIVKPPNMLLKDDCYNYAVGLPENVRTMKTPRRFREVLNLSRNRADLVALAKEIKTHYADAAANITGGLLLAREDGLRKNIGRPSNCMEVWNGLSEGMVEGLVSRIPREIRKKCIKRGLKQMLRIRSIRLYTIYYAWVVYSGWFGIQDNPRKLKAGDTGDWFHAVQASAANVFVTQESKTKTGKLPFILSQLPTPNFEVISLQEFLERL